MLNMLLRHVQDYNTHTLYINAENTAVLTVGAPAPVLRKAARYQVVFTTINNQLIVDSWLAVVVNAWYSTVPDPNIVPRIPSLRWHKLRDSCHVRILKCTVVVNREILSDSIKIISVKISFHSETYLRTVLYQLYGVFSNLKVTLGLRDRYPPPLTNIKISCLLRKRLNNFEWHTYKNIS